jgi:Yersinia/Haemophilus virulence surface antigen
LFFLAGRGGFGAWKSGSKADAYKQAVASTKGLELDAMREAEFDVLKAWVIHRNIKHRPQLKVDSVPYQGALAQVLSKLTDAAPVGLVISGGKLNITKSTGFEGHAIAYYQESRETLARVFDPMLGEFIEDNVGDAKQSDALKTRPNFEWPDYRSYRIGFLVP